MKFGELPICCVCSSRDIFLIELDNYYCERHIPKNRDKIGKYSGASRRIKGGYEKE
jgi:hypothetical protein